MCLFTCVLICQEDGWYGAFPTQYQQVLPANTLYDCCAIIDGYVTGRPRRASLIMALNYRTKPPIELIHHEAFSQVKMCLRQ